MKIYVKNIKAASLPDVVFEGGPRSSNSKSKKKTKVGLCRVRVLRALR